MSDTRKRLTRKQLIEHIAKIMPKNLTEIEKAAFIEVEVAKRIWFNETYLWGNTRDKIYNAAKNDAQRPKEHIKRKLICVTMSELYVYVAKQFGLDAKYQRDLADREIGGDKILEKLDTKEQEHVCPVVQLEDGRVIRVDIQGDLHNLKTHSSPDAFGTSENDPSVAELEQEEIYKIFRKIYGFKSGEFFTEDYINILNSKLYNREPIDKIQIFLEDSRIQEEFKKLGCAEARNFGKQILKQILGVSIAGTYFHNGTRAHITRCVLKNATGEKRYTICLYAEDFDKKIFYILSKKNREMVKISPEQLSYMIENSMVIPQTHKENLDFPLRKVIEGIKSYPKPSNDVNNMDMEEFFEEPEDNEEIK